MHRMHDGRQTTRAARASFQQSFVDEAIKMLGPDADGRAIARQAAINRKAYYAEFSAEGVAANKRAAAERRAQGSARRTRRAAFAHQYKSVA